MGRKILKTYKHQGSGFRIRQFANNADGTESWQVDCGRKSGKLLRKTETSKTAAEDWAMIKYREQEEVGRKAFEHSDKNRDDLKTSLAILEPFGCTLRAACQFYADRHQKIDTNNGIGHAIDRYWEEQEDRFNKGIIRERTFRESKRQLQAFREDFPKRSIQSFDADELNTWLDASSTGRTARENKRRYLKMLFGKCLEWGKADANPVPNQDAAEKAKAKKSREPSIYTTDEVRAVMNAAKTFSKGTEAKLFEIDGEMQRKERAAVIAYLSLGFWAGLRPTELLRIKWEDITLRRSGGSILVRQDVSKTGDDRRITMEPNLVKWMKVYGKKSGLVFPYSPNVLRSWRREVFDASGVTHKQDAARHSYATFHLAHHKNMTSTRICMGHTEGSAVLFNNYISLAEHVGEDAEGYFNIMPTDKGKLVKFPKAKSA